LDWFSILIDISTANAGLAIIIRLEAAKIRTRINEKLLLILPILIVESVFDKRILIKVS